MIKILSLIVRLCYGVLYVLFFPIRRWNKRHLGKVFFIHPFHTIPESERESYIRNKLKNNQNPYADRPHAVTVQKDKKVKIAKMYKVASEKSIQDNKKIRIDHGKFKGNAIQKVDHRYSLLSKETFIVGKPPLIKSEGKVSGKDLKKLRK